MKEQEFEQMLGRLMRTDFSIGNEEFRDTLLARCLEVLDEDEGICLEDAELDMLAAAGDPTASLLDAFKPNEPQLN